MNRLGQFARKGLPRGAGSVYDTGGRLTGTWLRNSGGTLLNQHLYAYNGGGQRSQMTRTDASYVTYGYDDDAQLVSAVGSGGQSTENLAYIYDPGWNLTNRTSGGTPVAYSVNDFNQATSLGGLSATYDANGNRTAQVYDANGPKTYTYTYDDENQLLSVATDTYYTSAASRWKSEFTYDGRGRLRIRKDYTWPSGSWYLVSEIRYLYDGMRVVQERNSSNVPTVAYTRGKDLSGSLEGAGGIGGLLARSHGYSGGTWSTHSCYHADGNGNITYLINASQAMVASYRYDPYGRTLSASGSLAAANTYRFSSKEIHPNSGMYYYGYRFYDPNTQRWLNRDPMGNRPVTFLWRGIERHLCPGELVIGPNLYKFVANDPNNHADADGRIIVPILIAGGTVLVVWGLWEMVDAIIHAQKCAENAANNRERQNDIIADPSIIFVPTRDQAVGSGLSDLAPDLYKMATGPGTLAGGPAGIPENAGGAAITIIWTGVQPEPEIKK